MESSLVLSEETEMPFQLLSPTCDKHTILIQQRSTNKVEQSSSMMAYVYAGIVHHPAARLQLLADFPRTAQQRAIAKHQQEKQERCLVAIQSGMEMKYRDIRARKQIKKKSRY